MTTAARCILLDTRTTKFGFPASGSLLPIQPLGGILGFSSSDIVITFEKDCDHSIEARCQAASKSLCESECRASVRLHSQLQNITVHPYLLASS